MYCNMQEETNNAEEEEMLNRQFCVDLRRLQERSLASADYLVRELIGSICELNRV